MGKYQITMRQWDAVMKGDSALEYDASESTGSNGPMIDLSCDDVQGHIVRPNNGTDDALCRLLTEAELEYACLTATVPKWSNGDNGEQLDRYARYANNAGKSTVSLGELYRVSARV